MKTSQIVDNQSLHTNNVYVPSLSKNDVDEKMLYNNLDGSAKGQFDICNSNCYIIGLVNNQAGCNEQRFKIICNIINMGWKQIGGFYMFPATGKCNNK